MRGGDPLRSFGVGFPSSDRTFDWRTASVGGEGVLSCGYLEAEWRRHAGNTSGSALSEYFISARGGVRHS